MSSLVSDLLAMANGPTRLSSSTFKKLDELRSRSGCKLLLCIGGWERSEGFVPLTAQPSRLKNFVTSLAAYCQKHTFAGVDYDWEHPKTEVEAAQYTRLIAETKRQFGPLKLEVTIAQAGWQKLDVEAYKLLDRVHLMAYDHDFPQATLEKASADVDAVVAAGCPPEKIALGVPFYGRNRQGAAKTYAELLAGGAPVSSDEHAGFAYNSPATLRRKIDMVHKRKLAGVMIWELGQDATSAQDSLLRVLVQ